MESKILYDPTTSVPFIFTSDFFKHLTLYFSAWYAIKDVVGPIKINPGKDYINKYLQLSALIILFISKTRIWKYPWQC